MTWWKMEEGGSSLCATDLYTYYLTVARHQDRIIPYMEYLIYNKYAYGVTIFLKILESILNET